MNNNFKNQKYHLFNKKRKNRKKVKFCDLKEEKNQINMNNGMYCRYYPRGMCVFGGSCRFIHVSGPEYVQLQTQQSQLQTQQQQPLNFQQQSQQQSFRSPIVTTSNNNNNNNSNNNNTTIDNSTIYDNEDGAKSLLITNNPNNKNNPSNNRDIKPDDPNSWVMAPVFVPKNNNLNKDKLSQQQQQNSSSIHNDIFSQNNYNNNNNNHDRNNFSMNNNNNLINYNNINQSTYFNCDMENSNKIGDVVVVDDDDNNVNNVNNTGKYQNQFSLEFPQPNKSYADVLIGACGGGDYLCEIGATGISVNNNHNGKCDTRSTTNVGDYNNGIINGFDVNHFNTSPTSTTNNPPLTAIPPSQTLRIFGTTTNTTKKSTILCPFEMNCSYGNLCSFEHGELCDMCGRYCLHPSDREQRKKHINACIQQHEKDMELSFAIARSKDKACGVCFDTIMEKSGREQRFGILPNCNHVYCLQCIRKWRQAKQFDNKITRACPECRTPSDFVCPSAFWVDTKEEKDKLLTDYKAALGEKDCKYFNKGQGKCPFGNKCFYKHALPNGALIDVGVPQRNIRKIQRANDEILDLFDSYLWDYVDRREYQWIDILSNLSDSDETDWSDEFE